MNEKVNYDLIAEFPAHCERVIWSCSVSADDRDFFSIVGRLWLLCMTAGAVTNNELSEITALRLHDCSYSSSVTDYTVKFGERR